MKELNIEKSSKLATLQEIKTFERENEFEFPLSLVNWFLEKNPISTAETLFKKADEKYWVSDFYPFNIETELSIQMVFASLNDFFESKYLAFACDAGGWQYVVSIQEIDFGKVYFCRMDEELEDALTELTNSFDEFIDGLDKFESMT